MRISFAPSQQSTLGVEWELALVDAQTGDLVPEAVGVVHDLGSPLVTGEFLTNTVELVTGVCRDVASAERDLRRAMDQLRSVTEPRGLALFAAGTHPFSSWHAQSVSPAERYEKLVDRTQIWGRQMVIYGVHVHVGLDRRDKALPILGGLLTHLPHLLALSASSPFWDGEDTGYASHRTLMFQQLPTAGLPFQFERWDQFEDYVHDLTVTGVIDDISENRWDVRPVPRFGTIEQRVCDGVTTVAEVTALAALTQCLVESWSRVLDAGGAIPTLQPWHVQENKWRAARYGLDAVVITDSANTERPVTEDLGELLEDLAPVAEDLGCSEELAGVRSILADGAGYQRQRALAAQHGGDLRAVTRDLVRATADS